MKKDIPRDEFIRKRMERQRRIRKRRLIIFFIVFIILLICVGITLSLTVFFPIENINVSGSKIYTAAEIQKESGIIAGDNLFTVSESRAEQMLRARLPYVESIEIKRELPDTISIKVKDADEYAVFKLNEKYYTVSKSGWVLNESEEAPQGLFVISGVEAELKTGSSVSFKEETEKELLENITAALLENEINIDAIDISDKIALSLKVEGRFTVNLGTSNNINEKIRHLSGMIKNISAEKRGNINLSMWTSDNTTGTFVEVTAE